MRLIDADALLKTIIQMSLDGNVFDRIHEAPTIEPQRKKGMWIEHNPHKCGLGIVFECSECGEKIECEPSNFCPNCGAEMEGEQDE